MANSSWNDGGKIGFIDKGAYSPSVEYTRLDYVYYSGMSFICRETTTGNAPDTSGLLTQYWMPIAGAVPILITDAQWTAIEAILST